MNKELLLFLLLVVCGHCLQWVELQNMREWDMDGGSMPMSTVTDVTPVNNQSTPLWPTSVLAQGFRLPSGARDCNHLVADVGISHRIGVRSHPPTFVHAWLWSGSTALDSGTGFRETNPPLVWSGNLSVPATLLAHMNQSSGGVSQVYHETHRLEFPPFPHVMTNTRTYWLGLSIGVARDYDTATATKNELRWLFASSKKINASRVNALASTYMFIDRYGNDAGLRHPTLKTWTSPPVAEPWISLPTHALSGTNHLALFLSAECFGPLDPASPLILKQGPPLPLYHPSQDVLLSTPSGKVSIPPLASSSSSSSPAALGPSPGPVSGPLSMAMTSPSPPSSVSGSSSSSSSSSNNPLPKSPSPTPWPWSSSHSSAMDWSNSPLAFSPNNNSALEPNGGGGGVRLTQGWLWALLSGLSVAFLLLVGSVFWCLHCYVQRTPGGGFRSHGSYQQVKDEQASQSLWVRAYDQLFGKNQQAKELKEDTLLTDPSQEPLSVMGSMDDDDDDDDSNSSMVELDVVEEKEEPITLARLASSLPNVPPLPEPVYYRDGETKKEEDDDDKKERRRMQEVSLDEKSRTQSPPPPKTAKKKNQNNSKKNKGKEKDKE